MYIPRLKDYATTWVVKDDAWNLKFVRKLYDEKTGKPILGLCDPSNFTVYIAMGQGRIQRLFTFFHEFQHSYEFSSDIDPNDKDKYTSEDYHEYIYQMEEFLPEFILNNRENFAKLFGFRNSAA